MPRVQKRRLLDSSSESEEDSSAANNLNHTGDDGNIDTTFNGNQNLDVTEINNEDAHGETSQTPNVIQSAQDIGSTSTPKQQDQLTNLSNRLDSLIKQHKFRLKQVRQEMKADNIEFLNVVQSELSGERVRADNESDETVMHNNVNLMAIAAGPDPSQFGRELAKAIFGENDKCMLINYMIGNERCKMNSRPRVDFGLERLFATVVRKKYPREPEFCLREARVAANQLGLDYKKKVMKAAVLESRADETEDEFY